MPDVLEIFFEILRQVLVLSNRDRNFSLGFGTNAKFIIKELDGSRQFSKGCRIKLLKNSIVGSTKLLQSSMSVKQMEN
ncbi:hypothetical protein LEP1GSC038_3875 [Leptospira weilii str. 2006001855]|uniref:Uncharacterized protein n=1 Tax=Leptospira weilii str. 2006001855 TaxID=996804 RepID=M6FMK1_9LEPT|nr:hypothetical protein LEP1GSC038_3875 [Leptospira weilii str. 2006001855]